MTLDLPAAPRRLPAAGWAVYLAVSWTWCIGMFLPVLLIRDYGLGGWLVFAVPNVIGAAAMGFVLRNGASERLVERHRGMMIAFSVITIAFHLYFIGWSGAANTFAGILGVAAILLALAVSFWALATRNGLAMLATVVVWLASLAGMAAVFVYRREYLLELPGWRPSATRDLLGLAPSCVFGFLLCPYLDLTFHRARQHTSAAGAKVASGVGFGVCFLAMIVFTLLYADLIEFPRVRDSIRQIIAWHWVVQAAITIGLHARETTLRVGRWSLAIWAAITPLLLIGYWIAGEYAEMTFGEIGYRVFMAAYGLLFPAYVLLTMIGRRPAWTSLAATLLASPLYWLGYIERRPAWIILAAIPIGLLFLVPKRSATIAADEGDLRPGQI